MITAETVNGIARFQANGLPVVSLYCRIDPGESRREHELPEFLRLQPHDLRGRVVGTFSADPATSPVAEIQGCAEGIVRRYQRRQDEQQVDQVLELAAMSAIETLLVRDGAAVPGVVCDGSRWLAASGELCPVCRSHTRYAPDILDELAAVVIGTGGSARQIAADLMSEEHLAAAKLRFTPPPPGQER